MPDMDLGLAARFFAGHGFGHTNCSRQTLEDIRDAVNARLSEMRSQAPFFKVFTLIGEHNGMIGGPEKLGINYAPTIKDIKSAVFVPMALNGGGKSVCTICPNGEVYFLSDETVTQEGAEYLIVRTGARVDPKMFFGGGETMEASATLFKHRPKVSVK